MDRNIFPLILQARWAMLPEAFHSLLQFAEKAVNTPELVAVAPSNRAEVQARNCEKKGATAIIPVIGPIFSKENILTLLFGGTALSTLAKVFESAIQDKSVDRVILCFDSPGGEVTGISEMAQKIYSARKQKQIVSYVYGSAASAAYWLASAASKVVLADTAQVGSIGVVAGYVDTRKRDEAAGINRISIVSSQSPRKNPDLTTEGGKVDIQKIVDDLASVFVNSVALHRGTSARNVIKNYGQGGISIGQNAVNIGMADEINTLDGLLAGKTGSIASGKGNTGPAAITTLEQLREIVGPSAGLLRAEQVSEEPASTKADKEAEEEASAIAGILAGANQGMRTKEPEAMDPEERKKRFFISSNR